jgi:carbon monoxide dehydrogenase subunit G
MKIDERFSINAPIDAVWAFVRNPQTVGFASQLRGREADLRSAIAQDCRRRTGQSMLLQCSCRDHRRTAPNRLVCATKGEEGGKASMITATTEIKFEALDSEHTEISCVSKISSVGRLGKFGFGIMKKRAAAQVAGDFAAALHQRMQIADA